MEMVVGDAFMKPNRLVVGLRVPEALPANAIRIEPEFGCCFVQVRANAA